jgi:prepilin-type N-terminal cleavage/methylation domain-containing protein
MSCPQFLKRSEGFTLIEALLAISIMAILAGVLLMVINPAQLQAKARDSKRASSLKVIQTALDLYRSDNSGASPGTNPGSCVNIATIATALVPKYIQSLPSDPKDPTISFMYLTNGSGYVLVAQMETAGSASASPCSGISKYGGAGYGSCTIASGYSCYGLESRGD